MLCLVGCGGTGGLAEQSGLGTDAYLALDLGSRTVVALGNAPASSSDTRIVFRRLPAATVTIGRPLSDNLVEGSDRPQAVVNLGAVLVAVTPLTQAQWLALTGDDTWLDVTSITGMTAARIVGPNLPAVGMTQEQVLAMCRDRSPAGWQLGLPSPALYEYLALAGSNARYAWGDDEDDVLVSQYARVYPATAVDAPAREAAFRPLPVGSLLPNAFGMYDLHGNVWQMTSATQGGRPIVCGGSWDQPVHQSRASNRMTLPTSLGLPTVGARLILTRVGG